VTLDAPGPTGPPGEVTEGFEVLAVRAQLFFSSYLPLFVILAIRFDGVPLKAIFAALAVLGAIDLIVVLAVIAPLTEAQHPYVEKIDDASGEVAGYLATYLLPFVTVPSPTTADLIGYGIFFVVLLAIFLRSNLAQVNPTLYLLGYRIAVITMGDVRRYLVCRKLPRAPRTLAVVPVAGLFINRTR
jgi:hypothetical protein